MFQMSGDFFARLKALREMNCGREAGRGYVQNNRLDKKSGSRFVLSLDSCKSGQCCDGEFTAPTHFNSSRAK
jgi:hypothetical protein